jgi:NAD+ synthase (glutamine-hydrolysing)
MKKLRLALCQLNPTVGDIKGNTEKIIRRIRSADDHKPDIVVFPELAVTGYPPEDLLHKRQFIDANIKAISTICESVDDAITIIGFVSKNVHLYNSAAIIHKRTVADIYHKVHLPNYGVFDEIRYFRPGSRCPLYLAGNVRFGINICEDIWIPDGPAAMQAAAGADIIININASPYHTSKPVERFDMLRSRARDNNIAIAYLNMTGGQDELVFDGHSLVVNHLGDLLVEGSRFEEEDIIVDLVLSDERTDDRNKFTNKQPGYKLEEVFLSERIDPAEKPALHRKDKVIELNNGSESPDCAEDVYKALLLGVRDYVQKNGFNKVCIGLSGGVDSSLVAAIAADSIGKDNVVGIFMPSPFTSEESRIDAFELAANLGMEILDIPISAILNSYIDTLKPEFRKTPSGIAEENIQARIRGNILMGMSNKFGWLVLTTGNKSEMSVGYATLYGDMAGGFAPIKDVPKTLVYSLCKWRNSQTSSTLIPDRVLTKEPTAELKCGQKDTDSLPPYEVLDPILKAYIEDLMGFADITALGFDDECVKKVINLVDKSEYKRRQAPPGIKITPMALGRDRRFPITNKYRSY